jgi:hypothetical protein
MLISNNDLFTVAPASSDCYTWSEDDEADMYKYPKHDETFLAIVKLVRILQNGTLCILQATDVDS